MSFMDNLKRSLGYEETPESLNKENNNESALENLSKMINNLTNSENKSSPQQKPHNQQYQSRPAKPSTPRPNPTPSPKPAAPTYRDEYEVIIPEQSFYEIVLIRPKTIDDINYVVDQVIEEKNPVILDLSFLEKESAANFKLAGEKINQMRSKHGVQALLLARTDDKDLVIVSPKKVKVINKG